jgi:hypothetical protein
MRRVLRGLTGVTGSVAIPLWFGSTLGLMILPPLWAFRPLQHRREPVIEVAGA